MNKLDAAELRYCREFPQILEAYSGQWVAVTVADGVIAHNDSYDGIADQLELLGPEPGTCVIRRVVPWNVRAFEPELQSEFFAAPSPTPSIK